MPSHAMEDRYVTRLRGASKREYARTYLAWMRDGREGAPPDYACSYYDAQEVRVYLEAPTPYSDAERSA